MKSAERKIRIKDIANLVLKLTLLKQGVPTPISFCDAAQHNTNGNILDTNTQLEIKKEHIFYYSVLVLFFSSMLVHEDDNQSPPSIDELAKGLYSCLKPNSNLSVKTDSSCDQEIFAAIEVYRNLLKEIRNNSAALSATLFDSQKFTTFKMFATSHIDSHITTSAICDTNNNRQYMMFSQYSETFVKSGFTYERGNYNFYDDIQDFLDLTNQNFVTTEINFKAYLHVFFKSNTPEKLNALCAAERRATEMLDAFKSGCQMYLISLGNNTENNDVSQKRGYIKAISDIIEDTSESYKTPFKKISAIVKILYANHDCQFLSTHRNSGNQLITFVPGWQKIKIQNREAALGSTFINYAQKAQDPTLVNQHLTSNEPTSAVLTTMMKNCVTNLRYHK